MFDSVQCRDSHKFFISIDPAVHGLKAKQSLLLQKASYYKYRDCCSHNGTMSILNALDLKSLKLIQQCALKQEGGI